MWRGRQRGVQNEFAEMGRAVVIRRRVENIDFILNVMGNEQGGKEGWLGEVWFTFQVSPGGCVEGDVQSGGHRGQVAIFVTEMIGAQGDEAGPGLWRKVRIGGSF